VGTYQIPVSPKNVVVAGRVDASGGDAGGWFEDAGAWARAAVDTHANAAARSADRTTVVISRTSSGTSKKQLSHDSTAELYSKSINDLREF
jgi:hypothetical protein